jgi:hypothetical protein
MARYRRYVDQWTAIRRGTTAAALRQAIAVVKSRGQFPSMQRVRAELEDPCWILEKWVRVEWKRIAEEMGTVRAPDGSRTQGRPARHHFHEVRLNAF